MISKIRALIKRGIISLLADDAGDYQIIQVSYLGKTSKAEAVFPFGAGGNPPEGASALLFNVEGLEENKAGIFYLPKDRFKFNEVHAWTGNPVSGSFIVFRESGDIEKTVTSNETADIAGDKSETIGGNVTLTISGNSTETTTGTVNMIGTTAVNINSSTVVNVVAPSVNLGTGTLRKLVDERIIFFTENHVHSGVVSGIQTSGKPVGTAGTVTTTETKAS